MDEKWIDSIKDKMADYEIAPPAGMLEAVEAKVRARKIRNRWIFGAVAASVALIGGVSIALIPDMPKVSSDPLVSDETVEKEGNDIEDEGINQIAETVMDSDPISVMSKSKRVVVVTNSGGQDSENPVLAETEDNPDESEVYEEQSQSKAESQSPRGDSDYERYSEYLSVAESIVSHSDTHAPVSVGVSTSANGLGGVLGDDGIESRPLPASAAIPRTRMGGGMLGSSNTVEPPAPRFIEVFDHKLPVRASVDFSWSLGYNLSVGTGITYSYLRSDISYGYSDSPLFKASQSLHFLGIPVNLRYTPWSFKKLDIYVSGGIMAEKCMAGGIKTENPQDPEYSYAGCDDRPFQFSVNAAVGLEYSLAGGCAVFIEPGLGFYLKNGSRLRTIYTERPVTFNVNIGLRFHR